MRAPMKGNPMNKTLVVAALGTVMINAASAAYGVYKIYEMQKQIDAEMNAAKEEINRTVNKLGKAFQTFEL